MVDLELLDTLHCTYQSTTSGSSIAQQLLGDYLSRLRHQVCHKLYTLSVSSEVDVKRKQLNYIGGELYLYPHTRWQRTAYTDLSTILAGHIPTRATHTIAGS